MSQLLRFDFSSVDFTQLIDVIGFGIYAIICCGYAVIVLGIQICSSSLYFFQSNSQNHIYMHIYFVLLVVVNSASVLVFL